MSVIVAEEFVFTIEERRLYVSQARGAYQVAVEAEMAFAQTRSKRESGHVETDLERGAQGRLERTPQLETLQVREASSQTQEPHLP